MTLVRLADARGRLLPGRVGFLYRLKDLIDRGRVDVAQIRLAEVLRWLLTVRRADQRSPVSELCEVAEAAAALALSKARRLTGYLEPPEESEPSVWMGPPPELAVRRSWLSARVASGLRSFAAAPRMFEGSAPQLAPVPPSALRSAMLAVLGRARPAPPPTPSPVRPRVSVERACALIEERLVLQGEVRLDEIGSDTRDGRVALFLACLMLARQGRVRLVQDEPFAAIIIRRPAEAVQVTA